LFEIPLLKAQNDYRHGHLATPRLRMKFNDGNRLLCKLIFYFQGGHHDFRDGCVG